MGDPSNDVDPAIPRTVRLPESEWGRAEEAARVLSAREHLDLTVTDIVRRAIRREVEDILGTPSLSTGS